MELIAFLPPMVGSLTGVLLAYILAKGTERYFNVQKRAKWLEVIRTELIQSNSELEENIRFKKVFFAIDNELLRALISSGDLNLFAANEAIALTFVYNNIENYGKSIERANKRIEQLRNSANIEDPYYRSLLKELDELEEKRKKGDQSKGVIDRIEQINDELRCIEIYSEVNTNTACFFGNETGFQMRRIFKTILEQEWFKDEEKHYFFPKHMTTSDEKILGFRKISDVPGST